MAGDADFEITPREVVPQFAGYGAQFNQHVFAKLTDAPAATFPDLEQKVVGLQPQLARIFFNDAYYHALPDQKESFQRTAGLAQQAGATINVTWQSGIKAYTEDPAPFMARFADALDELVHRNVTSLRWVTIQNEPNTPPQRKKDPEHPDVQGPLLAKAVTPEKLADLYHRLDGLLQQKGLRGQLKFMGGDLIQNNQQLWFDHMAQSLHGLLDAYSVHIYWNYWQPAKFRDRLTDVIGIVRALPDQARKPVFVTEYGVRGRNRAPNKHDPGDFAEGGADPVVLGESTVAAFQHAWFQVVAAQLGFAGTIVWDCYFGKYDKVGTLAYYGIGPPLDDGRWPLLPAYWALRLLTMTIDPGWKVFAVDRSPGAATKEVSAFGSGAGELTVVGLDSRGGAGGDDDTAEPYSIGGLTAGATLSLVLWNRGGGGRLFVESPVIVGADGVARFSVPRRAVFSLTTKHFSP